MALKIGILGGGQLGRMLLSPAMDFGLDISILDPDQDAPCKMYCHQFYVGDLNSYHDVFSFGMEMDVITIEIENVNVDALIDLQKEGVKIIPDPQHLKLIQDKGLQKQFYLENNIPTANFFIASNHDDLKSKITGFPFIQKLRKGGYDGRGVQKIKSETDFSLLFDQPSIVEEVIDFSMEISVLVARKENGEFVVYDPVEMKFNPEKNIVEFLIIPARISSEIAKKALSTAIALVEKMQFVGLLAVELFVDKNENVLVNEIAPRPHNSGHHTIEACVTSQYEQLLRIIANYPLGATTLLSPAVTINILGENGYEGNVEYDGLEKVLQMEQSYIHLYGKKITKPYRKMGHITTLHSDLETAITISEKIINTLKAKA